MSSTRLRYFPFLLLLLLLNLVTYSIARADDDEADEYDVKARIARISLIDGEVNLKRSDNTDWERARVNATLIEGDTISTGMNGKVEIQIDGRNFLRLGSSSELRIVTLRDEGVAFS